MTNPDSHPFARFVRILGRGKTGTRSLDIDEAREAFTMVLAGAVLDLQLGAFLMLLRVKEESPEELAGFVQASRAHMAQPPAAVAVDLDWSSYAGKKHQHPWYVLAMLLLAGAGYRVLAHGCAGHTPGRLYTEQAFTDLGLPVTHSWDDAANGLARGLPVYYPLESLCPPLARLVHLKPVLGLRSPVNTLTRMLNPAEAPASLQSIFHPAYARLHQEADRLLAQPRAMVFKGESGEVEIKPNADTRLYSLMESGAAETLLPRSIEARVADVDAPATAPLRALWRDEHADDYGRRATLGTTAAALLLLDASLDTQAALQRAESLWRGRARELLG